MGGYAWVTLATNDSYSLGALVLAHSLRKSNTAHKLAVLITPAVSQPMREQLQTVFDVVKTVDVLDSKDEAHLALMKRPELGITFTKIHCWRLTEFEKCVFLDADTFVVRNCDELFEREEFSAAPDVSWPDCFNSGVFVYKPSVETFNKLLQFAIEKGSFDGGDQGLLNQFFSDWATEDIKKHLPFVYNLTSVAAYSYIPAFKQYGAETRIVHFIGTGKPWLHQLDPATRTVTPTSGSEHLAPLLQQWWDLFCERVHPNLSKNLENNNDGMSHPHVEACSNTPVALTSDEPQPPRLIEPCLQYREKDDYRQHNLPYQPFDVRGSSGELLNVEFLLASVVPPENLGEQQRRDAGEELEEKDTKPEVKEEEADDAEQTKSEIIDNKAEEKQEEQPTPKDPFDYNTFFPDEKCINNYLEQNVLTYQPFEAPLEDPLPENIPLPRFLTMPEDDQRQKGNIEVVEPPPPPPPPPSPVAQEKHVEVQRQPSPPPVVEKHELPKSKSMTFISSDVTGPDNSSSSVRSIWKSQPNVNVDINRKYSMPRLKPLLPRQNSKSIQSPVPRVTLYTEFLMSADYKDPVDIPKDEVGFVESELRRSKSEADLKGKFGPLPYTKSPEIKMPKPKKPPLQDLDNDTYDLTRCKRQLGNKPRDDKKENITSKLITSSKDKISTLIKKRKSKELSPGDGGKEKPLKKERKEHKSDKKKENLDKILNRLCGFSKNYQHYFGIDMQNGIKENPNQSEFKNFRSFVKDQKETMEKGLSGLHDIMIEKTDSTKIRNENVSRSSDPETPKVVKGLRKVGDKNTVGKSNSEVKIRREKNIQTEELKTLIVSPDRCKVSTEKQSSGPLNQELVTNNGVSEKPETDSLTTLETISNDRNGTTTREGEISPDKHSENIHRDKTTPKSEVANLRENSIKQNGCVSVTDNITEGNSIKSRKVKETVTQSEKIDDSIPETSTNGCISLPRVSLESPQKKISDKSKKDRTQAMEIIKPPQPELLSTSTTKKPENEIGDSSYPLTSQKNLTRLSQGPENSELLKNTVGDKENTIMVTQANGEISKIQENEETRELSFEKLEHHSNVIKSECQSDSLENSNKPVVNGEEKENQLNTAEPIEKVQQEVETTPPSQKPSERHENSVQSCVHTPTLAETEEEAKPGLNTILQNSETYGAEKTKGQEKPSSPIEKTAPKIMFTIGSPEKGTEIQEKDSTQPNESIASSQSSEQTEEIPQTSKVWDNIPKPDEILCVPDFETPRSSRNLAPILKPDTDATSQAPPSSPIATPRKARIQRKPYENGTKYRSPAGKKIIKTGNKKHVVGIAGAIAQLNLEAGGKGNDSEATSAAHQEYIRRQNWESGNIDYMGRDSFENVWSKICQTLEGKELDKATESTQSPMTISTEEKTKPEGISGAETPGSFSGNCPEFIDALPSEPVTGPVEDDEIIFSKPEIKQKCLTNIKEEEENGGASEGGCVKLSDILKPKETRPQTTIDGAAKAGNALLESNLNRKLPEEAKPDEKPSASSIPSVPSLSYAAKSVNEQVELGCEPQAPVEEIIKTQPRKPETDIKPQTPSECTTVAIRQQISIPGAPSEVQTAAKTPAQKIAEKKLQQKPETPTEPIPLPAPESPTQTECKTVAIPYSPLIAALTDEKQPPVEGATESVSLSSPETPAKTSSKEEKQKKGVFSKLLEMVGVAPKIEEISKSVFYDVKEAIPIGESLEVIEPNTFVEEAKKESESVMSKNEPKEQETTPDSKPGNEGETSEPKTVKGPDETSEPEIKQELQSSIPASGKPAPDVKPGSEGGKKKSASENRKSGQAPMPKPARNASPKSPIRTTKNKSPSPITIRQTPPETALTVATPTPAPEPPKRRNSALLKVDESIPVTPPVMEAPKESTEPLKSEIENIIEKAKAEAESILQEGQIVEKETEESDEVNTMKLIGAESQPKGEEIEELKVTSEEERQRHKSEVVSSKLSDQILKAIPPPRRKAISESKSEASGSSGAIPKTPSGEKPKNKASSIPVPPPRNKGKPSTPAPPKGKTKK